MTDQATLTPSITKVAEIFPQGFIKQNFASQGCTWKFENYVYAFASKSITGYNGGMWTAAHTHNGTPIMYPGMDSEGDVTLTHPVFGQSAEFPVELAGLLITMWAVYHELELNPSESLEKLFYAILDDGREIASELGCSRAYFDLTD